MEGEWIKKSAYGPLMMAIQHIGALYKYDVARMYASILRSSGFMIPIKCGEFQHLTDEELATMKSIPFGIYRATIVGTHGAFKHNKNDYYTHYDLIFAKELGLTFNLKSGNKANALIYDSSCRKFGSDLFGKYIDQVLGWIDACEPKSRLEELCKCLYQRLWGALSKRNKTKQCVNMECDEEVIKTSDGQRTIKHIDINVDEDYSIDRITPTANGSAMIKSVCNTDMFDTPFARIMPFIISRGRKMIGTIIKDDIANIKRVHTDGFVSTKPWTEKTGKKSLDYAKLGKECGDLRYEGYCPDASVKNMTKPVGSFAIGEREQDIKASVSKYNDSDSDCDDLSVDDSDDPSDYDEDEDTDPSMFRYLDKKDSARALRQLKTWYKCAQEDIHRQRVQLVKERDQYKDKLNNMIAELFSIYKKYGPGSTL
ncbi:hypothetical protein SAMD00019534_078280 [Acytostelium subglobosum LB1]|uniref:hypothetical protein n=1 Tax=Acytostelium subglobosum LB1 TaxID=1410327 RepID=UPI000644F92D|nr:hypothetical protein SAMD00019534_078280 [Acytostelium subglobosum LB1]GAM24653.1 hypothetical protein SAMD00019534_078280 [Acytostelium subglobosum LB1]|eukprot:XP_012752322.1 hypothetical protein SAMD00019534_078280 [Acytostelium subglobosum LB1]